jgi:glycerophosphoryl diester phosphodiesterase
VDWQARGVGLRVGGHRGASAVAPENTYAAFERAIADGALYTETDVRATSDGALVLVHDPTLDRTTDGSGPVSAMTLAELRRLDAGSWFDASFSGQRIPEYPDFLAWIESRAPFGAAIEIKARGIGGRVAEMAWMSAARDRLCIYAFDAEEIVAAKAAAPDLPCILLLHLTDDPGEVVGRIAACGADGADVPWQWNAVDLHAQMRSRGWLIGGGSDEGGHAARELVEQGVDVIDTDDPAALLAAVRGLGGANGAEGG